MNLDNLLEFVTPYYKEKDIMHDLSHINRVLIYVDKLLREGYYNADIEVLKYAAHFHGFIYNNEETIKAWMKNNDFSDDLIDKIITVSWESQKSEKVKTLEGKILHDAHMIEGGKTYLIVKSFKMLNRYLITQGKDSSWYDKLGTERKRIGDFACYISYIYIA